jgi:hypothetical protein
MIVPDGYDYGREAEVDFNSNMSPATYVLLVQERYKEAVRYSMSTKDPWWENWSLRFNQLWLDKVDQLSLSDSISHRAALIYWWNRNEKIDINYTSKYRKGAMRRLDKDAKALKKIAEGSATKADKRVTAFVNKRYTELKRHLYAYFNASKKRGLKGSGNDPPGTQGQRRKGSTKYNITTTSVHRNRSVGGIICN